MLAEIMVERAPEGGLAEAVAQHVDHGAAALVQVPVEHVPRLVEHVRHHGAAVAAGVLLEVAVHVEEALEDLRRFGHASETPVQEIDASYRRLCRA